jgi:DNA helicase-2/ATP-dependent DNA helicase PcrA
MALNKDQLAAATHKGRHAIVLAGPGTGKTSTLVARHAYLRMKLNVDPDAIAAISFTQKAAEEIRSRIGDGAPSNAWIGTFHGLCLRLLKRFNVEANLAKNFKVLDPSAQRSLFFEVGIDWDQDDGDLVDIIGRWKDSLVSPSQAASDAASKNNTVLRKAAAHYETYEDALARKGHLDFSDLLVRATSLVEKGTKARQFVSERLPHFLVDEFQDVNRSQVEFLIALAQAGCIIWAVADDDQAIYGWRGGRVFYTVQFETYFPGSTKYFLMANYRCDPAIIVAANTVIGHNHNRVAKQLRPTKEHRSSSTVRVRAFPTDRAEAEWVAAAVTKLIASGAPPQDIAVLFRSSGVTAQLQQAFERAKIPFALSGTQNFWELPEVTAMVDMLVAIEKGDTQKGSKFKGGRDIIDTMKGSGPNETALSAARLVADQPPAGLNSERQASWMDTAYAIADIARDFVTAEAFKAYVLEMSTRSGAESGGVSLSTIHSSKGLEWKQVFVLGCEAGQLPHHRNDDIEEERRLFYVAITRSKGAVDISYAKQRYGKAQTVSSFLGELNGAPKGAVHFYGDEFTVSAALAPGASKPTTAVQKPGQAPVMKTYILKDGRRSMIPPDER